MKLKKIFSKRFLVLAFGLLLFSCIPFAVSANLKDPLIFVPQVGIPGFDATTTLSKNDTSYIGKMVKSFYDYGLAIGGILAAIMLMAGGVLWLTSAGSSDQVGKAKNLILGSITGLLLLFGAWIILKTVNPALISLQVSKIAKIERTTLGGCCLVKKQSLGLMVNEATSVSIESECEGTYRPDSQPDPNDPFPNKCINTGCCHVDLNNSIYSGNFTGPRQIDFPSAQEDCEGADFSSIIPGNEIFYTWQPKPCSTSGAEDCREKKDGVFCYDRSANTIAGDLGATSACLYDGQCGFCYNGFCLPKKGRVGDVCGNSVTPGVCKSGSSCGQNSTHVSGGRDCVSGSLCCQDKSEIINE